MRRTTPSCGFGGGGGAGPGKHPDIATSTNSTGLPIRLNWEPRCQKSDRQVVHFGCMSGAFMTTISGRDFEFVPALYRPSTALRPTLARTRPESDGGYCIEYNRY